LCNQAVSCLAEWLLRLTALVGGVWHPTTDDWQLTWRAALCHLCVLCLCRWKVLLYETSTECVAGCALTECVAGCALTGWRRRKRSVSEPRWWGRGDRCVWTTEHSQPSVYRR